MLLRRTIMRSWRERCLVLKSTLFYRPKGICRLYSSTGSVEAAGYTRNIGIIAHIDAGKTTTTERILYLTGAIRQAGGLFKGNTVMDYLPAERERGITIQSAAISLTWADHAINLIDTPGHADFTFEVERALSVLDGAVTIFDGVAGVEAQTEKVWNQANSRKLPRIAFINKLDRTGADYAGTVTQMRQILRTQPALMQLPIYHTTAASDSLVGLCDLLSMKVMLWQNGDVDPVQVTNVQDFEDGRLHDSAVAARETLVELLSSLDENVVEAFLDSSDAVSVPEITLKQSIRKLCLQREVTPVVLGASFQNVGLQPLLQAVIDYLPSPQEVHLPRVSNVNNTAKIPSNVALVYAFKVIVDSQKGPMIFVRVYQGTLKKGSVMHNTTTNTKERIQKLYHISADSTTEVGEITAGNIGIIAGLRTTRTGDTLLGSSSIKGTIQTIAIPPAVFSVTLDTDSPTQAKALTAALTNLLLEDPSLTLKVDPETEQMTLNGMGELHLEIATNRLREHFKAKVQVGEVQIGYRETVSGSISLERSVERAQGDKRAAAHIAISIEPMLEAEEADQVIKLDGNHLVVELPQSESSPAFSQAEARDAILNGISSAIVSGPLFGYPMHGCRFQVKLAAYEPNTTLSILSIAAREVCSEAIKSMNRQNLLVVEPLMAVTLSVPESYLGLVLNDLTSNRSGQVSSLADTDQDNEHEDLRRNREVQAFVPLQHMVGYSQVLRQITGGRATFTMQVHSFRPVDSRTMQRMQQA